MSKRMAVAAALPMTLVAALTALPSSGGAADAVVLQLHRPAQFEFAGYYAALWRGFYGDAGLAVEIRPAPAPGKRPIDPVREVTAGRANFGTGTAALVIRAAEGQRLLMLAPIFQRSGAAVYYRADGDFPSPAALVKARLGRLPASDILDIELATTLAAEGIDAGKLRAVPLEAGEGLAELAGGKVDAVMGSAWELPWQARDKGIALKSLDPAVYRVEFYGDTVFTAQRFADAEPERVRRFLAASLKGWDYAFKHADEIAGRIGAELPAPIGVADPAGFARYQAELAPRLAGYPEIPLGHSNRERWSRIEASLVGAGALVRSADPDTFLYNPNAAATGGGIDPRTAAILGAVLVVGFGLAWLGRHRAALRATARLARSMLAARVVRRSAAARPSRADRPAASPTPAARVPAPVDLNTTLSRLERAIRRRVPRRIRFRLSLLPKLWRCRADLDIVKQLVLDLVGAALADMTASGDLVVGTRNFAFGEATIADYPGARVGEFVRVTVKDTGPGTAITLLDQIFDPKAMARPAAAAAAQAMRQLGGFARVESAEGVGTAVHLYFPRAAEANAAKAAPGTAAEAAE